MRRCILFFLGALCFSFVCNTVCGQRLSANDRLAQEAGNATATPSNQYPVDFLEKVFWVSSLESETDKVKIVNSFGQVVPVPLSGDLNDLPEDVYFISLKTRYGKQTMRFVVH
ncbi:MAG: T9SS type A sorting domain-containing protein [Bacteroidota bacterium]